MTDIKQLFPYPDIKNKRQKNHPRITVTSEEAKLINEWCRNPLRVKEVIRRFHIWSLKHQWCADDETREWVKQDLKNIKKNLGI